MAYKIKRKGARICKECGLNEASGYLQKYPLCNSCRDKIRWGNTPKNIKLNPEFMKQR
jgi:hypothetical protein